MAPTGRRWLVILNPASGTGRKAGLDSAIQNGFLRFGISAQIRFTGGPGEATELAAEHSGNFEVIVAAGGDGTVRETAIGLFGSTCSLGILPLGSGNGLARHLRLSTHLPTAIEQLAHASAHPSDAYQINGRPGVNVGGIGFDGEIARLFSGQKKRGLNGYLNLIFSIFSKYPEFQAEFSEGGVIENVPAFFVAAANGSQFGNNAIIARDALITDGLLNIRTIRKPSWKQMPGLCLSLYRRRPHDLVSTRLATELILKTSTPQPIHADGDFIEVTDQIRIKVIPSAFRILIPNS